MYIHRILAAADNVAAIIKDINMSTTRGLYLPLSIIQGDTLDFSFSVKEYSDFLDLINLNMEGQIVNVEDDTFPEVFTFVEDDEDPDYIHAVVDAITTASMVAGKYIYQIRYTNEAGALVTTLYGSLIVEPSPLAS